MNLHLDLCAWMGLISNISLTQLFKYRDYVDIFFFFLSISQTDKTTKCRLLAVSANLTFR